MEDISRQIVELARQNGFEEFTEGEAVSRIRAMSPETHINFVLSREGRNPLLMAVYRNKDDMVMFRAVDPQYIVVLEMPEKYLEELRTDPMKLEADTTGIGLEIARENNMPVVPFLLHLASLEDRVAAILGVKYYTDLANSEMVAAATVLLDAVARSGMVDDMAKRLREGNT